MDPELLKLAEVYFRYCARREDADFWAYQKVTDMVKSSLEDAWLIVRVLVERSDSHTALSYVAAGALEDFIDGYGDAAIDILESSSETDQKMQLALSGVWLERESPVLTRWRGLMQRYGFMGGSRQPLSKHPDCWF